MHRRRLLALSAFAVISTGSPAAARKAAVRTRVVTELGAIVIEVHTDVAPLTVANYLAYVDRKLLDKASVYRLVTLANQPPDTPHKIEVVQWGLNLPDGQASPLAPIAHESTQLTGLRHLDGTVSMARAQPGTAASEFFFCVGAQPALDFGGGRNPDGQGFAAFGRVVSGIAVVRALHSKAQAQQFLSQPIAIRSVRRTS
jgi:peptidyl-prolyl cis-trans isomerase A (cyclophilin A)